MGWWLEGVVVGGVVVGWCCGWMGCWLYGKRVGGRGGWTERGGWLGGVVVGRKEAVGWDLKEGTRGVKL